MERNREQETGNSMQGFGIADFGFHAISNPKSKISTPPCPMPHAQIFISQDPNCGTIKSGDKKILIR
jgi:hypothetical protein